MGRGVKYGLINLSSALVFVACGAFWSVIILQVRAVFAVFC